MPPPLSLKLTDCPSNTIRRSLFDSHPLKQVRDLKELFDFCCTPRPDLPDSHPANRTLDGYNRWPQGQVRGRQRQRRPGCQADCYSYCLDIHKRAKAVPPLQLVLQAAPPAPSSNRLFACLSWYCGCAAARVPGSHEGLPG